MISKRARAGQVQVTFSLPLDEPAGAVSVVGPFNGWEPGATPLKKNAKAGDRRATVTLEKGGRTPFRYVVGEGEQWFDDDAADDHEPNEHGTTNGIVLT